MSFQFELLNGFDILNLKLLGICIVSSKILFFILSVLKSLKTSSSILEISLVFFQIPDLLSNEQAEIRIKINVRLLDNELTDNSISVQMFTQKFDGSSWIDQGQDNEKAIKIKESILAEARSLKTAVDLS